MQLKIDKVITRWKNKNEEEYISKFGKPYCKVSVQSNGEWYSTFDFNGQCRDWAVGQIIDVEVEEKEGFKNIILPKKENMFSGTQNRLMDLEKRISTIEKHLGIEVHGKVEFKQAKTSFKTSSPIEDEDVDSNELPF